MEYDNDMLCKLYLIAYVFQWRTEIGKQTTLVSVSEKKKCTNPRQGWSYTVTELRISDLTNQITLMSPFFRAVRERCCHTLVVSDSVPEEYKKLLFPPPINSVLLSQKTGVTFCSVAASP